MVASITSANSSLVLGVTDLFPVPVDVTWASSDNFYSVDAVDNKEIRIGVDGNISAGWVPQMFVVHVSLQADSPSMYFFDQWYAAEQTLRGVYEAFGVIQQPSLSIQYTLSRGFMTKFAPFADAKKVLEPRTFDITFNSVLATPLI